MKKLRNDDGFTLIELMTVVIIIGILASIIIPQYSKQVDSARTGRVKAELASIKQVLDLYYAENKKYPLLGSANDFTKPDTFRKVLLDNGIDWKMLDPWKNTYRYSVNNAATPTLYVICSYGPNAASQGVDDVYVTSSSAPEVGDVTEQAGSVTSSGS